MKTRLIVVLALSFLLVLATGFGLKVVAQGAISRSPSPVPSAEQPAAVFVNTSEWDYELDYAVYLPLVQRDYVEVCTARPTLISPVDGSSLDTLIPLFVMDNGDVADSMGLGLQTSTDPTFATTVDSVKYSARPGRFTFRFGHNYDPATTYYWRAWFICGDVDGPYTDVWSFTTGSDGTLLPAPSLDSPPDGSTVPSNEVTLRWLALPGAQGYIVNWRQEDGYVWIYTWTTDPEWPIPQNYLRPGKTYEWWVAAYNEYAIGADSVAWKFTVPAAVD